MFTELTGTTARNHIGARGRQVLLSFLALVFTVTISPTKARAQIVGELEVNIPFPFYAGNAKLPAGKYAVHQLSDTDLKVMEISSADGATSALFEVRDAETNSAPRKSELIFNKYGKQYFLAKIFDSDNPDGSALEESRYEKKVDQSTAEAQAHVPAHHKGQQGS